MLKNAAWVTLIMILFTLPAGANEPELMSYYTIGGPRPDFGYSIEPTNDGGYIIAGISQSLGDHYSDAWLIKLNSTGETEWEHAYGGSQVEEARHAIQTPDGGYLLTGKTCSYANSEFSDLWLVKTDPLGEPIWMRTYGEDNGEELGSFVQNTADGGYIVVGRSNSFGEGDYDIYLIKLNAQGEMRWQRTLGGNNDDLGYTVRERSDGYVVAGYTNSFGVGKEDMCLIFTNENGEQESVKTYGGDDSDFGAYLTQTLDGGYILSGESHSEGYGGSIWIVKTDDAGHQEWTYCCGGTYLDGSYGIINDFERGYLMAGWTETEESGNTDAVVIKLDEFGVEDWRCSYDMNSEDVGLGLQQDSEGNCFMVGYTYTGSALSFDLFVAQLREIGELGIDPLAGDKPEIYELSDIFPNPSNGSAIIPFSLPEAEQVLISIYDCRGRLVRRIADRYFAAGHHQVVLESAGLSSGTYLILLQAGKFIQTTSYTLIK